MKPVLVAVDFSNTSIHAIEYAVALVNKMKSDIHLIWVDKVGAQESVYPDTSNENRNEAKKRFDDMAEQYKGKLTKGISLEYKLKKGKVYHEIDNYAKLIDAELIITGSHGISGYEEYWIGSNAYKIVSYATKPVITVRHDYPVGKGIRRIVVPMDGSQETLQKIPFVLKLAKLYKSEIHVVTTHNSHLKSIQRIAEKMTQTALTHMRKFEVTIVEDSIVSNDLTKAVLNYTESVKADLIAMMTEQETPVNILLGAQAQQLINQSPVPVLSIHSQEKFSLT
jgi:nucleotide-binding universal stress UspA family protein